MKRSTWFIVIVVLPLLVSTTQLGQTSAAEKINFTATERFDPLGLIGPPVGAILAPGTLTCPGNDPTGNPAQPCPPGSNTHVRGNKRLVRLDSSDPLVAGWITIESNVNWDSEFTGPMWGIFTLELDAGGTWEVTWTGRREREGNQWVAVNHGSGRGIAGAVEGMHMSVTDRVVTVCPLFCPNIGAATGRIVDPHSK